MGRNRAAGAALVAALLVACAEEADPGAVADATTSSWEATDRTEAESTTTTELEVRPGGNAGVGDGFYPVADVAPGACAEAGGDAIPDLDDANCYRLDTGASLDPEVVESAEARPGNTGLWQVDLVLTDDGIDAFNGLAAECADQSPTCPLGQLAVVVSGRVVTAPRIMEPSFERDAITLSGAFTSDDALEVAAALAG